MSKGELRGRRPLSVFGASSPRLSLIDGDRGSATRSATAPPSSTPLAPLWLTGLGRRRVFPAPAARLPRPHLPELLGRNGGSWPIEAARWSVRSRSALRSAGGEAELLANRASAPSGVEQPNLDTESSIEDGLPVPARRSSGGKRCRRRSPRKHAQRRRDDMSSSYSVSDLARDPGPSQPNSDTASSMEDSLPVPAKRSSGGKRHRRRSSRKHAKRRRADSSSSYTGLSAIRIWMVGHSIIHWAGVAARQSELGPGLGLPSHVRVSWLSRRGMRWSEFLPRIRRQLLLEGPPEAIVVQLGENDLVATDCLSLRAAILADLETLRAMVPTAKIFWSKLLQRRVWLGSRCPVATERARKRINAAVSKRIVELGGEVIFHHEISYPAAALFRADGVHLSASGNEVWLGAVVAKLRSWLGL
ncbi:uncharacterized protein LOC144328787 [Podarcis muralis]